MSKPYRPSNGTEGLYFFNAWCDRCKKDRDQSCEILARTMLYEVDEPEYPKEWVADDGIGTNSRCTAFEALK